CTRVFTYACNVSTTTRISASSLPSGNPSTEPERGGSNVSPWFRFLARRRWPNRSARRSNCPSRWNERSCDGERAPHDSEAQVFCEHERADGVDDPVVAHGRYKCDGVADEQHPPCP